MASVAIGWSNCQNWHFSPTATDAIASRKLSELTVIGLGSTGGDSLRDSSAYRIIVTPAGGNCPQLQPNI